MGERKFLELSNNAMRIEWDIASKREVEEAKSFYRAARQEGRKIVDLNNNPITAFKPALLGIIITDTELTESQFAMRIHDKTGDRRLIWDAKDPKQITEAGKLFNEYIDKGWKAYMIDEKGKRSQRIYGFDAQNQELFFDEQKVSLKQKLSAFVGSFKGREMKLLPKTYPG
jgi:hypothetical protein